MTVSYNSNGMSGYFIACLYQIAMVLLLLIVCFVAGFRVTHQTYIYQTLLNAAYTQPATSIYSTDCDGLIYFKFHVSIHPTLRCRKMLYDEKFQKHSMAIFMYTRGGIIFSPHSIH